MAAIAQVTLFMDSDGNLHAEMPNLGMGAGRNKLLLTDFDKDILSTTGVFQALVLQKQKIDLEAARKEKREEEDFLLRGKKSASYRQDLSRRVFDNIAENHSIVLAERAVPSLRRTAKTVRKVDVSKLGQNTQNTQSEPAPSAKTPRKAKEVGKILKLEF